MIQRRSISVGTKLAVATVVVLAGLSLLLFKELTTRERRRLVEAKSVAGEMVTDLFAASCAAPLVFEDNDAVTTELVKLKGNKAIVYAAVYASKPDQTVGELNLANLPRFDFAHGKIQRRTVETSDLIEIVQDIRNTRQEIVGFAVVRFSLADENAAYAVSRRRLLSFSFFGALGTALVLILLARLVIVKPLARVADAARRLEKGDLHARADVKSKDEVGNLASVFNSMGDAIVDREQKVIQAQKNVQDLFDHMLQAVFTVGPDGRINKEVSAFAKQIFGQVPIAGELVADLLRLDTLTDLEAVSRMKFFLATIFGSGELQWELCEPDRLQKLSYKRVNADGSEEERAIELDYAPIFKNDELVKIMFLVKDVTEMVRLQAEIERRDQQNRENLARIRQIAAMEPDLFHTFISEAYSVLDGCEKAIVELEDPSRRVAAVNSLFRGMHTLKGNARMFKLAAVQDIAHATEDYFQKVRDGEVSLDGQVGSAMRERVAEVRVLLGEFEKLGRQVLGGEQESPGDVAMAFLRTREHSFDDWQHDLAAMNEEDGVSRERLKERATKLVNEAQSHGFVNIVGELEAVVAEIGKPEASATAVTAGLQRVKESFHRTRSLAHEIHAVELWPYFVEEARGLVRSLAAKIGQTIGRTNGRPSLEAIDNADVVQFSAAARSFGVQTLSNIACECYRSMAAGTLDARQALKTLEDWMADAKNLVEMSSHPEVDVDMLARFREDAEDLEERLNAAAVSQVGSLLGLAIACARRYRFAAVQDVLETLASAPAKEGDGRKVAAVLKRQSDIYDRIRREVRDNEAALHLMLVPPTPGGEGEQNVDTWLEAASRAGLTNLVSYARTLPLPQRFKLFSDIRHFQVLIPASRGSKSGQPVQRVLEGRIAALRDSLRGLREAVTHAREHGETILPPLENLERAVVHLTTSSLGDVLAPAGTSAAELARERGKALDEVTFEGLDLFLDPKLMQKVRDAVVHAVRNSVDHGLEPSDARISAGKPPRGRISIVGEENDGWVTVSIEDDGRGVDTNRVKEVAIARGLVTAERAATMSVEEVHELVFLPGFSTASSVSSVSGRGVGMDVIAAIAKELHGSVRLKSTPGRGAKIVLHFPTRPNEEERPVIRIGGTRQFKAASLVL